MRHPRLAQLIEVRPELKVEAPISAPISIELGGLPLSIGLFAGSGIAFLARGGLPEGWPQTVATIAGAGLAVAGIFNLVIPKAEAVPPGAPAPRRPGMPAPAAPPVPTEEPYVPPTTTAFGQIEGRILEPIEGSQVDLWPWSGSYPVRVQIHNPSTAAVTFELELTAQEDPEPTGSPAVSGKTVQVSVGPGEVFDVPTIAMPIATWGAGVDYVNVTLQAKKRRTPAEAGQMLDIRGFVIE